MAQNINKTNTNKMNNNLLIIQETRIIQNKNKYVALYKDNTKSSHNTNN